MEGDLALTVIWMVFFLLGFLGALYQWVFMGDTTVFADLTRSMFDMAKLGVEIAIGLIGVLCLWMGLFQIAERAGLIQWLARGLAPLFRRLMPEVPAGHPANGAVTMNLAANMLGLDNAATPMGLKAMQELQTLNPAPDTASNAQILFLVLNTSSVTLIPVTIFLYRAQQGASDPTSVFIPILLATSTSTIVGLATVCWVQRLRILDRVVLSYAAGFALLMALFISYLAGLDAQALSLRSSLIANLLLVLVVIGFILAGWYRSIDVYATFIDGAKQGFEVCVRLIPFLVAMLVAIGVLRAGGVLDRVLDIFQFTFASLGFNTDFVSALPTAMMKPLSGSGARAMLLDTMNTYGVDSFAARTAAVIQGSTETTFYVLAVYFGSVGIRKTRHAVACGLAADFAGIFAAIIAAYWFFGG